MNKEGFGANKTFEEIEKHLEKPGKNCCLSVAGPDFHDMILVFDLCELAIQKGYKFTHDKGMVLVTNTAPLQPRKSKASATPKTSIKKERTRKEH